MLTHNAPKYVYKSIKSLKEVTKTGIQYELLVVDNKSDLLTRCILKHLKAQKYIDKLVFNTDNSLFAKGNNIASSLSDQKTKYYLLLNSDVEIMNPEWLDKLLAIHPAEGGISSYGFVNDEPKRADGYCMMIGQSHL